MVALVTQRVASRAYLGSSELNLSLVLLSGQHLHVCTLPRSDGARATFSVFWWEDGADSSRSTGMSEAGA